MIILRGSRCGNNVIPIVGDYVMVLSVPFRTAYQVTLKAALAVCGILQCRFNRNDRMRLAHLKLRYFFFEASLHKSFCWILLLQQLCQIKLLLLLHARKHLKLQRFCVARFFSIFHLFDSAFITFKKWHPHPYPHPQRSCSKA